MHGVGRTRAEDWMGGNGFKTANHASSNEDVEEQHLEEQHQGEEATTKDVAVDNSTKKVDQVEHGTPKPTRPPPPKKQPETVGTPTTKAGQATATATVRTPTTKAAISTSKEQSPLQTAKAAAVIQAYANAGNKVQTTNPSPPPATLATNSGSNNLKATPAAGTSF